MKFEILLGVFQQRDGKYVHLQRHSPAYWTSVYHLLGLEGCVCMLEARKSDHRNIKAKQRVTSGEKEPMKDSKQENGMNEMIRYTFLYANPGGNMDNRCSRDAHSEATAIQDR